MLKYLGRYLGPKLGPYTIRKKKYITVSFLSIGVEAGDRRHNMLVSTYKHRQSADIPICRYLPTGNFQISKLGKLSHCNLANDSGMPFGPITLEPVGRRLNKNYKTTRG